LLQEVKKNNIKLISPNINKSTNEYYIEDDMLILPFKIIKNLN